MPPRRSRQCCFLGSGRTPVLHALSSDGPTILRFVQRLQRQVGAVRCCDEARACGFELQRALAQHGIPCDVIAPALIPRRPGDCIKTDRRDGGQLGVLYRADTLTAIDIPTEQEEARHEAGGGAITKTGNAHLRRVLVEAAWYYRHPPFVGDTLRTRQRGAPPSVIAHAWTAQQRLHRRYQRLAARGKPKPHVVTAWLVNSRALSGRH